MLVEPKDPVISPTHLPRCSFPLPKCFIFVFFIFFLDPQIHFILVTNLFVSDRFGEEGGQELVWGGHYPFRAFLRGSTRCNRRRWWWVILYHPLRVNKTNEHTNWKVSYSWSSPLTKSSLLTNVWNPIPLLISREGNVSEMCLRGCRSGDLYGQCAKWGRVCFTTRWINIWRDSQSKISLWSSLWPTWLLGSQKLRSLQYWSTLLN